MQIVQCSAKINSITQHPYSLFECFQYLKHGDPGKSEISDRLGRLFLKVLLLASLLFFVSLATTVL